MGYTKKKATKSVAVATAHLIDRGWEVAVPTDHSGPVDLVARRGESGTWQNVQVKSFYQTPSGKTANLCRTTATGRKPYTSDEVDLFVLVDNNTSIIMPFYNAFGRTRIAWNSAQRVCTGAQLFFNF